jgi:hypothetical protein
MIASSGHTMEYVGSGTDYRALPEYATGTYPLGSGTSPNGVHQESHQKVERNNGKVWAAITDHNGKFRVGDTFSVDQQSGFVSIPAGALSVNTLLENLDVNGKKIVSDSGNENIVISPHGTGTVDVESSRITSVSDPTGAQDAATKNYVDNFTGGTSNIGDGSVTNAKLASGAVDTTKMSGATVVTNSEHAAATTNDTSFFTTSASDARYFRQDSSETITSGITWSSDDANIATTAAIDARVIDLVDDVGGFVPITNETSFPTANPDVNNGAGTLVSIKEIATSRTPSNGTVTIANGSGSNTVTINGCGTTVLAAGFGAIVETTSTLHTYTFHRLTPKATEVTTVAGISSNVTTVAGISSDVTTVAGISSDVTTVANNDANVTAVAGRATEIGRLGTADAVADLNTLGTADVVADLNTLGTADVVSDMNTLATSSNVTAMSNCSDDISNINTVAGSISNVNTTAGSISNVNTVASNISSVNDFAARYRVSASAPTTSLDDGDLWFDTTNDTLKVYDASSSAWVTGVTDTTGFVTTAGATMTGQLNTITPTSGDNATNKTYVDGTIDSKIDTALTSDVVGGTGITVSDNTPGNGQITVAVTAGSIGATQLASTAVTAATYGASQSGVPSFTVDADGRLTAASTDTSPTFSGNVEVGTGIDLNTDGSASFASGNTEVESNGVVRVGPSTGTALGFIDINRSSASSSGIFLRGQAGSSRDTKFEIFADGSASFAGNVTLQANLDMQDNDKILLGTGDDLQIYHNGNHSYIDDAGQGDLVIRGSGAIKLEKYTGETLANFLADGAVNLFYNNSTKLSTKSDGIDVTGEVQCDSLDVDGNADINGQVGFKSAPTSGRTLEVESSSSAAIRIKNGSAANGAYLNFWDYQTSGANQNYLGCDGNNLVYKPNSSEVFRIDSSGRLLVGTTTEGDSSADELTVANSTNAGITIRSGTTHYGSLFFSDATSGTGEYEGFVQYNHSSRLLYLGVASQTRLTINSSGNATFTGTVTASGFNLSSLAALP